MHYYHIEQLPNRLNNIWCLLQENPTTLMVGATTKLVRNIKAKKHSLGQTFRGSRAAPAVGSSSQISPQLVE